MRHDMRKTLLTMLGMAWGIATVVLLLAYGNGFGDAIQHIFESFGATAVGVFPGRTSQQAGGNKAGVQIRFTSDDVELLRNVVPLVRHISRESSRQSNVGYESRTYSFPIQGNDASIKDIWNLSVSDGRFFNESDNMSHAFVAVIGSEAKDKLFSGLPAVGESISVDGFSFQVIGVMSPRMQEGDNDINRLIYIPYNSMDVLQNTRYLGGIWLDSQGLDHTKLTNVVRSSLAMAHSFRADDQRAVFIFDAQKQLSQFGVISLGLKILLGFIGTITLGIGGIGLMNIMLVSVTERTREIGVRKAIGATRRNILLQFLFEAIVLTALGGLIGILAGWAIAVVIRTLAPVLPAAVSAFWVAIGFGTAVGTGLIFGLYPAYRAAILSPIEALRTE